MPRWGGTAAAFIGFELGKAFAPFGRIYSLEVFRGLMGVRACLGAKHSSLHREPEWQRLIERDRLRPDFRVFTGNDLAIDMVMYGSDYLLGLSTFAPDLFARRDEMWAEGDPAFYELNDMLQYLGFLAFRPPVPAYKHAAAMFLHLRGWIASDRTHPGSPTPAGERPRRLAQHRATPRRHQGGGVMSIQRISSLKTPEALRRHAAALGHRPAGGRRAGGRPRRAAGAALRPSRRHDRQPVRDPADGGLGRHRRRPTDRPDPSSMAALRPQRGQADLGGRGGRRPPRRPRQPAPVAPINDRNLSEIVGLRDAAGDAHREHFGKTDDLLVGLQLTHSGRFSRPDDHRRLRPVIAYRHPLLDPVVGVRDDGPVIDDDGIARLVEDFVPAARMAREAGFAFVDIKHCHGYLGHEFLSAVRSARPLRRYRWRTGAGFSARSSRASGPRRRAWRSASG